MPAWTVLVTASREFQGNNHSIRFDSGTAKEALERLGSGTTSGKWP